MADNTLKQTQLHVWHVAHNAKMVPFAGWDMPLQYEAGAKAEHLATRESAGLFDIDHMGQIAISGPDATDFVNRLVTWDVSQMTENDAHYALMCYEDGGIVDDVFIYRLHMRWFIIVNADNRAKDLAWMEAQAHGFDVSVNDVSDETYMIALQGPQAITILQRLTDIYLRGIARFTVAEGLVNGTNTLISRTGYTGEDGVELYFSADRAQEMWNAILTAGEPDGILPVGLAARDSLRFEPGFALYGHEIDATITPQEARLNWAVNFDVDFIGRNALLKRKLEGGVQRRLVSFEMVEKGVPRQGYDVVYQDEHVGHVASGLYAPTLDKFAGNAFVPSSISKPGTEIQIAIRDKLKTAVIVRRPMYRPTYRDA